MRPVGRIGLQMEYGPAAETVGVKAFAAGAITGPMHIGPGSILLFPNVGASLLAFDAVEVYWSLQRQPQLRGGGIF